MCAVLRPLATCERGGQPVAALSGTQLGWSARDGKSAIDKEGTHAAVCNEKRTSGPHTSTTTVLGRAPLPLARAASVALRAARRSVAASRGIGVPRPSASPVRLYMIASRGSGGATCTRAGTQT